MVSRTLSLSRYGFWRSANGALSLPTESLAAATDAPDGDSGREELPRIAERLELQSVPGRVAHEERPLLPGPPGEARASPTPGFDTQLSSAGPLVLEGSGAYAGYTVVIERAPVEDAEEAQYDTAGFGSGSF